MSAAKACGLGKRLDRGGQVRVGRGVAAHEPPDPRQERREVGPVEPTEQPLRHRELEHHEAPAGPQRAVDLAKRARRVADVADAETDERGVEARGPHREPLAVASGEPGPRGVAPALELAARPASACPARGRRRGRSCAGRARPPRSAGRRCRCRGRAPAAADRARGSRPPAAASARRSPRRAAGSAGRSAARSGRTSTAPPPSRAPPASGRPPCSSCALRRDHRRSGILPWCGEPGGRCRDDEVAEAHPAVEVEGPHHLAQVRRAAPANAPRRGSRPRPRHPPGTGGGAEPGGRAAAAAARCPRASPARGRAPARCPGSRAANAVPRAGRSRRPGRRRACRSRPPRAGRRARARPAECRSGPGSRARRRLAPPPAPGRARGATLP